MIKFLDREYKSALWLASGTFGWGVEAWQRNFFPKMAGALVTKGVSPANMDGAPQSRISEINGVALLNAIGLQNPGLDNFILKYANSYKNNEPNVPIWINVFANKVEGYVEVINKVSAFAVNDNWLAGFEINVSCPNVDKGGVEFGTDTNQLSLLTKALRQATKHKIMVKLSPMVTDPRPLAMAAVDAGADALAISNTILAGLPEPEKTKGSETQWSLGRRYGGMSGPALKPIALRMLDQVAKVVKVPLCGIGGIQTKHDVQEFMAAGASVVQVGTANFANPWIIDEIS